MTTNNTKDKIILFDLDGTLIDSTEAILESFTKAYEHFDVEVPKEDAIKSLIGLPLELMFVELGVSKEACLSYANAYKAHYSTIHTQKTVLLPKVKEAIELAHTYAKLGIVTTKTSAYSRILLEHFDLMKYFDVLIGREDVQNPKPDPEPVFKALKGIECHLDDVIYFIGDTCADMRAAKAAKVTGIGVLCGYMTQKQLSACTTLIKDNSYEAVKMIKSIL